jgi:hypothetical protein
MTVRPEASGDPEMRPRRSAYATGSFETEMIVDRSRAGEPVRAPRLC